MSHNISQISSQVIQVLHHLQSQLRSIHTNNIYMIMDQISRVSMQFRGVWHVQITDNQNMATYGSSFKITDNQTHD